MWWSYFSKLKPSRVSRKKRVLFQYLKTLRIVRKWWNSFSALITLKVVRKWRIPFFSIKNVNFRKAVMEFFLSFRSFKSGKKVTESFFSGHTSLSFHMMQKFQGTIFSLSVPTDFFYYTFFWVCILISVKKDAEHISVNTVKPTFLLQK